jgi:ABC-2 type transport system permease protein
MSGREVITTIARREISERIRQKAFLVSAGITLLFVVLIAVLPAILGGGDRETYRVGTTSAADAQVVRLADELAGPDGPVVRSRSFGDRREAGRALDDERVEAVLAGRTIESVDDPDQALVQLLQAASRQLAAERVLDGAGVDEETRRRALTPPPLEVRAETGSGDSAEKRGGLAFAIVIVLYGQLLTFGYLVASGVVEEKSSRVVELLLAAVRPSHLLAGKVIGLGLLALGQLLMFAVVGFGLAGALGTVDLDADTLSAAGLAFVWFLLGYAFYACAFACAGALVPRQEELQSSTTPLTMSIMVSFFLSFLVVEDPGGTLATVTSFLPTTAPMTMPSRIALGEAPVWQIVVAALVTAGSAVALIPLAARIYSGALLRTGSAIKLREAWRAARG